MDRPRFSILIATRNRAELAAEAARRMLDEPGPGIEILILDQSDDEGTRLGIERLAATDSRLQWLRVDGIGKCRGLNFGLPRARGEWIVLTDDDCLVDPGWLAALERESRAAGPRDTIVGRVRPGPVAPGFAPPPAILDEPEPTAWSGSVARDLIYPNFAAPTALFHEIGGFDERLGPGTRLPGGEDNDFGYRLLRAGWRILYRPSLSVMHRAWRAPVERAALKRSYGLGQGAFYGRHLARLDPFIAYRLVLDLGRTSVAALWARVGGRRDEARGHVWFLTGMVRGVAGMFALMAKGAPGDRLPRGRVLALDLGRDPLRLPPAPPGTRVTYLLLRWHGRPVGRVTLDETRMPGPERLGALLLDAAAAGITAAKGEGPAAEPGLARLLPAATAGPGPGDVSVVIASRDRPGDLEECLRAIRGLPQQPGEILVADSASRDAEAVARAAARNGARLVRVPLPGLSRARNAGAAAATRPIVAFLDDDCRPDPGWLSGLCAGFRLAGVEAVAGQLLPLEVATAAQRLFLRCFHMDRRGFVPRRFDLKSAPSRHWPLDPWRVGSGGNLAVRRDALVRQGGFRIDLGLGTPARGGEDLYFLWRVLRDGGALAYRPDALAWHRHHRDMASLRRVVFGYGAGHAAFLRAARRSGAPAASVYRCRAAFHAGRWLRLGASVVGLSPIPPGLVLREIAGHLRGGALGRRAARQARRDGTGQPAAVPVGARG